MSGRSNFVADDFDVPDVLETPEFRLRMLTVNDLIKDYDAVMSSELESGLDARLFNTVKNWLADDWPFESPAFPGRDIDWRVWESLERTG